jgi:hypothetical protein
MGFQQRFDPLPQNDIGTTFPVQHCSPLGWGLFDDLQKQVLYALWIAGHE